MKWKRGWEYVKGEGRGIGGERDEKEDEVIYGEKVDGKGMIREE